MRLRPRAGSVEAGRQFPRRRAVARFRPHLVKLGTLTFLLFFALVLLATKVERETAALLLIGATVAVTIAGASAIAYQITPDYGEFHAKASTTFIAAWGFARRSAVWGVTAATMGVLLSDAVPNRIVDAFATDPNALPIKGFMAVVFGAVGVATALVEEWRVRLPADEDDASPAPPVRGGGNFAPSHLAQVAGVPVRQIESRRHIRSPAERASAPRLGQGARPPVAWRRPGPSDVTLPARAAPSGAGAHRQGRRDPAATPRPECRERG
jgi:hypothetical protein